LSQLYPPIGFVNVTISSPNYDARLNTSASIALNDYSGSYEVFSEGEVPYIHRGGISVGKRCILTQINPCADPGLYYFSDCKCLGSPIYPGWHWEVSVGENMNPGFARGTVFLRPLSSFGSMSLWYSHNYAPYGDGDSYPCLSDHTASIS
jgi:hypothetical protein